MVDIVRRHELKYLAVCMVLFGLAAGWLILTRPPHSIEGDFLQREDRRTVDRWLLEQLRNPIAEHRARACLALGRIGKADTLGILVQTLRDPIPRVRAAAAFAIGEMEDRDTVAETGHKPRKKAASALIAALRDRHRTVVEHAVEALGKLRWKAASVHITRTPAPLPVTMRALVRMGDRKAVPWIAARRRSDDAETRWAATRALLDLGANVDDELTRSFINLTKDRNPWMRIEAVRGLGRAQPSQEVLDLLTRMSNDADPKVRMQAMSSLAKTGKPEVFKVLVKALGDANENVRAAAVDSLGLLGDSRARPLLESLLSEGRLLSLRSELALARLDVFAVLPTEPGALPPRYRGAGLYTLLDSLRLRKTEDATSYLLGLWRSDSEDLSAAKPKILPELLAREVPQTEGLLDEALNHEDQRVVSAALLLTTEPPLENCRALYGYGLQANDTGLRANALTTVARSADRSGARALLLEALDDPDRRIRKRAVRYLRVLFGESHDQRIGAIEVDLKPKHYQELARSRSRLIRMETSLGLMELRLDYANAPLTSRNFVELAERGFYDGKRFMEVIPGAYAKAGDQDGSGSPEHTIRTEIHYEPFLRGSLAMAEDEKDAAGNQFFICLAPQPLWEGRYTNFGRLVSGDDLLDRITTDTRILRIVIP